MAKSENVELNKCIKGMNSHNKTKMINGRVLAFAYIRLHKRKEACKTLEIVIEKLSGDEDYVRSVKEYKEILEQIK